MKNPRLIRRLIFILAAVLLVPLTLAGGVLGWLGTDSGENWLREEGLGQLNSVLKDSGLSLSAESLSGPLPGKLSVRGLVVTDKHGAWLNVGEAEIILNLSRIVRGQLTVTSVTVTDPVLLRLPDLPPSKPSPDDMETDVLALAHDIPAWLPALRVEDLAVRGLRVPARLLDPKAAAEAVVGFDLDGTLAVPVYTELRTMLDVRRTHPSADRLRLDAALSVNARGLDQMLDLSVDFSETEGGLLQAFVPELRGLNVALTGKAPLQNWKGALRLDAPGLGLVQGTVQGALLSPERTLHLELNATPDATLPAPWPAVLEKAGLTLSAIMAPGLMELKRAEVRLPGLGASAQVSGLSVKDHAHEATLAGEIRLSVDTAGFAQGFPPQIFPQGMPKPPFNAVAVLAMFSGTVQAPELALETQITGLRPDVRLAATDALIKSKLALTADNLTLSTDCSANANGLQVHVDAALSGAPVGLARTGVFPDFSTPAGVEALLRELGLSLTVSVEAAPDALKAMAVAPAGKDAKGFIADLSATLNWPTAQVSLRSPGVRVQDQAWSDLRVNVELGTVQPISNTPAKPVGPAEPVGPVGPAVRGEPTLQATASLTTPHGPAHMELSGVWREHLIHITSLTAEAAGLRLSGQVRALLEEATRLDGRFALNVADWSALAPLLPVPFSAGTAVMDLRLAPEQNQSAEMTLQMTNLTISGVSAATGSTATGSNATGSTATGSTATGSVTIDSLNFSGKATDVFTSPRITASLDAGSGSAGTTAGWQAFSAQLKTHVPGAAAGIAELELAANLVNLTAQGLSVPPLNVALTGGLTRDGKHFSLDLRGEGLGLEPMSGLVQVPVRQHDGIIEPDMTAPLSGFLRWQGQLGPVWRLVPVANCRVRGEGFVDLTLAGTLARPRPGGSVRLENVLFQELTQALELSHMRAEVLFSPTGPASIKASGNGGRAGDFTFSGTMDVFDPQLPVDVRGQFNRVAPFLRQDLRLSFSGEAGVRGLLLRPEVFADLTVNSGELRVEKLPGGGVTTLDVVNAEVNPTPSAVSENSSLGASHTTEAAASAENLPPATPETGVLNVTVTVPNRFYVRGHGLESEWGGKLRVTGPFNAPMVNGQLASVRGTMSFLGKLFVLSKGEIIFDGGTPPKPMLNVQVTYARQDFTALIELLGPATNPRLRLSSQPHLPTGDIVAQILFGSTASGLGRAEAIQLGATLASLSLYSSQGGSIVDITRESLGLDVLRVGSRRGLGSSTSDNTRNFQPFGNTGLGQNGAGAAGLSRENAPDSENELALEVGKYVLDNVYVGVEQGMGQDSTGVVVDIEVTPSVSLEAKTTGRGTELGVIWSWDY